MILKKPPLKAEAFFFLFCAFLSVVLGILFCHSELEPKNLLDVSLSLNMTGQILRRFIPQNDNGEIMPVYWKSGGRDYLISYKVLSAEGY